MDTDAILNWLRNFDDESLDPTGATGVLKRLDENLPKKCLIASTAFRGHRQCL